MSLAFKRKATAIAFDSSRTIWFDHAYCPSNDLILKQKLWTWEELKEHWQNFKVIIGTDDLSRESAVRLRIRELRYCSFSSFRHSSEDSFGSFVCFHSEQDDFNFKKADLSYTFLKSLLSREMCTYKNASFESYVSERCYEERLSILAGTTSRWDYEIQKLLDEIYDIKRTIEDEVLDMTYDLYCLDCCAERLISSSNDNGTASARTAVPISVIRGNFYTNILYSCKHIELLLDFASADLEFYGKVVNKIFWTSAELQRTADYIRKLRRSPDMQAAIIQRKPILKEDALLFALKQECYLEHLVNFVGDSDQLYLIIFSSNPGCAACERTVDQRSPGCAACEKTAEQIANLLESHFYASRGTSIKVFYFSGRFGEAPYSKNKRC